MSHLSALVATAFSMAIVMPASAQAETVEGHYFLEGVMETGSELLIRPDGRFQFYLVYGALDLFADGTWQKSGNTVVLTSDPPKPGYEQVLAFKTLNLIVTKTDQQKAALETYSNDKRMLYVRHGNVK